MVRQSTLSKLVRGEWVPMTYEEFLAWAPDGTRTGWTDGEGIDYITACDRHQALVLLLASTLDGFVRLFDLGRVSLAPYPMKPWTDGPHREPDLHFVAAANFDRRTETRLNGPADFVFEVLSEDTASEYRGRKLQQYAALGIPGYLMTGSRPGRYLFDSLRRDPTGNYQPVEPDEDGRYHSDVLPGFWLRPEWFRQDPSVLENASVDLVPPIGRRRRISTSSLLPTCPPIDGMVGRTRR